MYMLKVKPNIYSFIFLTINLLNFLNGKIHFPFLELSIIIFRDIKVTSQQANSIEPGQTEGMCRLPGSKLVAKANHFQFQQDKG